MPVKSKVKILQKFVAFSDYMNFNKKEFTLVRISPAIFEWGKLLTFKFHEFTLYRHALCGVIKLFGNISVAQNLKNL